MGGTGGTQRKAVGPARASIDARNFGKFGFCGQSRARKVSEWRPICPSLTLAVSKSPSACLAGKDGQAVLDQDP